MVKADDSRLAPDDLRVVEERARKLLNRADAWGIFPTPIDQVVATANLTVAPTSAFDPAAIMEYIKHKGADATRWLKSAISKVFGLYDGFDNVIHIDDTVVRTKQNFLKLHETGHHEMPTHRKTFRIFQECSKTLDPAIADQFEREANNFARFALFQGDAYRNRAADYKLSIKSPLKLAKEFDASLYASAREFARTSARACVVYALEGIEFVNGQGARAAVRRIEPSPSFVAVFGKPADTVITLDHPLGPVLPIGRRMKGPVSLELTDLNGERHECLAEAFDTKHNVLILLYPTKSLATSVLITSSQSG